MPQLAVSLTQCPRLPNGEQRSAGVKVTTVLAGDKGRSKLQLVPDALLSKFGPDGVLLTEVCTYS